MVEVPFTQNRRTPQSSGPMPRELTKMDEDTRLAQVAAMDPSHEEMPLSRWIMSAQSETD